MPDHPNATPDTTHAHTRDALRPSTFGPRVAAALVAALCTASVCAATYAQTAAPEAVRERRVETKEAEAKEAEAGVESEVSAEVSADAKASEDQSKGGKSEAERARLRREQAEQLAVEGHKSEAVAELRAMSGEERFDPAHFYNVGNALARLGESSAAVEVYRKAIAQRRGNYARAQHNLGVVLMRLGRWEEAREALASAVRLEGGSYPEASYNLGRLHALRGEAGLAIAEWTRALARKPDHADAAVALARALADDGDPERGLSVLDTFTERQEARGKPVAREIAVARGEIVAALNIAGVAAKDGTRAAASETFLTTGGAYRRAGAGAIGSLTVDQQTYQLLRRARSARESERNEEAAALFRRVITNRGGYFPPANLELGFALISLRRDEEAAATLRAVAERDGTHYPVAFYHLGRIYERLGQLRRSSEAFTRASSLYGDSHPQILVELSRVGEKEGDLRAAVEAMEKYVLAAGRAGDTSDWAHARLTRLREKLSAANAQPK